MLDIDLYQKKCYLNYCSVPLIRSTSMFDIVVKLVGSIQKLCIPFAYPENFSQEDWHSRISLITKISEILSLIFSEYPCFISKKMEDKVVEKHEPVTIEKELKNYLDFQLVTPARTISQRIKDYSPLIDYRNVLKDTTKMDNVVNVFKGVVSVEKLAISTCSLAICKYDLPISVVIILTEIMRDECLHLLALSRLIGVDPLFDGWIASKRKAACQAPEILDTSFQTFFPTIHL